MSDLPGIFAELRRLENSKQTYAMATLVRVSGSSYRTVGARMLITRDHAFGSISGGCLENDVIERSRQVLKDGKAQLVTYETSGNDDIFWGTGLGCRGTVGVFIDCPGAFCSEFELLFQGLQDDRPAAFATVFRCEGAYEHLTGSRFFFDDGVAELDLGDAELARELTSDLRSTLECGVSNTLSLTRPLGAVEMLVECVTPPLSLVIFGGGYDVISLLWLSEQLGWRTTLVDHREAMDSQRRFPDAGQVLQWRDGSLPKELRLNSRTVCVVMTHNYLRDKEIVNELLISPARYVGVLGPKARTEEILDGLRNEGTEITGAHLEKLFGPVGLDLGADNAEEIAVAIAAEILAVVNRRQGGFLRQRAGGIHKRQA